MVEEYSMKKYVVAILLVISGSMFLLIAFDFLGVIETGYSVAFKDLVALEIQDSTISILRYVFIIFGYLSVFLTTFRINRSKFNSISKRIKKTTIAILIALIVSFWFILSDFSIFQNVLYVHVPIFIFEILALQKLK